MKALILAAGMGKRMNGMNGEKPKSYLQIGDRAIIRHQIDALKAAGISGFDIYIVMGYGFGHIVSDFCEDHALIANHFWKYTNTAASVQIACDWADIHEDMLIINGDVIFDPQLIQDLVSSPAKNAAIVQFKKVGEEEIKVAMEGKRIVVIGKKIAKPVGEAVGLYKLSAEAIKQYAEAFTASDFGNYYEDVFNRMKMKMEAIDAKDLFVKEIDTPEDYEEATKAYNQQHDSHL